MQRHWRRLIEDETGFIISSELVLVGTVAVLGMIVGLEAVSSAVIQELNDLAHAFGSMSQSFNFRSISKVGHAWVSGSGFSDRGDFCDCVPIAQTDVVGRFGGTIGESVAVAPGPIVQERVISEKVVEEKPIITPKPTAPVCCETKGEIIEEHIIRRRIAPDCTTTVLPALPTETPMPQPERKQKPEKAPPKPKKN